MEKYLMEKFKKILDEEQDINNIEMFTNLDGCVVVKYEYADEQYIVSIENAYWLD